jgi:pyruvate/2-oxoglutarate dehydrogenase complex dihydrolipoamide dehydrogenase (E3) component
VNWQVKVGEEVVEAKQVIVATGSKAASPARASRSTTRSSATTSGALDLDACRSASP